MVRKYRLATFAILLGMVVILGITLPFVLSRNETGQTGEVGQALQPTATPMRPASTAGGEEAEPVEILGTGEITNCTYPMIYWQNRPEAWPAEITLGGKIYTKEDIRDIYSDEDPDPYTALVQQVYTALLNILHGASGLVIEDTLIEANEWLESNQNEEGLSQLTRNQARNTAQILARFNDGEIGPGVCDGAAEAIALYSAPSPTTLAFIVAGDGAETPPAFAATPTTQIVVLPTATPTEEPPEPDEPPLPAPTEPHPPEPTATPVPQLTETPVSTPTALPTATATPEPEPALHPQLERLASKYDVSYDELEHWHSQGYGIGDIDKAYELSQETGVPVSEIFDLLDEGLDWSEIRERLTSG
jgi:hypothetical protein